MSQMARSRAQIADVVNRLRNNPVFYTEVRPPLRLNVHTGNEETMMTRDIDMIRMASDEKVIVIMRHPERSDGEDYRSSDDEYWRLQCIPDDSDTNMRLIGDPSKYKLRLRYYESKGAKFRVVGEVSGIEVLSHD